MLVGIDKCLYCKHDLNGGKLLFFFKVTFQLNTQHLAKLKLPHSFQGWVCISHTNQSILGEADQMEVWGSPSPGRPPVRLIWGDLPSPRKPEKLPRHDGRNIWNEASDVNVGWSCNYCLHLHYLTLRSTTRFFRRGVLGEQWVHWEAVEPQNTVVCARTAYVCVCYQREVCWGLNTAIFCR